MKRVQRVAGHRLATRRVPMDWVVRVVVVLIWGLAASVCCFGQSAGTQKPAAAPQKVIIDTDIGDDVDDAFAVALALRSPELQILGVTTTFGDTETRAKLLDR